MSTPMTPSEIRKELLEQHAALTTLAQAVRGAAQHRLQAPQLWRQHLRTLAGALDEHNQREEQALRDLMRSIDAWGATRVALMDDHHAEEHSRIHSALRAAAATDAGAEAVDQVLQALDHLAMHMKREEAELLHADVLRDDVITVSQSDG